MRWTTVGREILANALMSVPVIRRMRVKAGRTIGSGLQKFRGQLSELEHELGDVTGRRVVELGPGDVIPMGWEVLRRGASSYVAVDRFGGSFDGPAAREIYAAMGAPTSFPASDVEARRVAYRLEPAEDFEIEDPPADLVFSMDVLEHVSDPAEVFRCAYRALRPGGRMVHKVDLSPHAQWRRAQNPLEFLTIPDKLWSLMGSQRGLPNRLRAPDFRRSLEQSGFLIERFDVKGRFRREDVEAIRPRLASRFREMDTEDLLPTHLVIVASRPDA
jgi:SAM-dependent methyltransferase